MNISSFNWKISAKAGEGIMSSSRLFAKACKRQGLTAFNYYEYPSLIKGGIQSGQVFTSTFGATCQRKILNLLIIFHENFIQNHLEEIDQNTLIIVNSNSFNRNKYPNIKSKILAIDLNQLVKDEGADPLTVNVAVLGLSARLLNMNLKTISKIITEEFSKNKNSVSQNITVLNAAYKKTDEIIKQGILQEIGTLASSKEDKQLLLTGNEAVGLGALAAGLQFYSAYPMTPATGLMHYLAAMQKNYPIIVKHAEDEIGAINHALGASFAGVRSMTGSSGGGFALMVEALSFAGVSEIPLVILEAMRQGPATGLPTWTSQGDLNFVLQAGHGDFLKIVLTPGDVYEHYLLTKLAFKLAEKYQLPVIILSDKFILESSQTIPKIKLISTNQRLSMVNDGKLGKTNIKENEYLRYKYTKNGISLRSIPGQTSAFQLTNSYEHDEFGFATEDAVTTKNAVDKRISKIHVLTKELPKPIYLGVSNPKMIFISFGSTINVLKNLLLEKSTKDKIAVIHLPCIYPFSSKELEKLINNKEAKVFVLEGNATGQLSTLIRGVSKINNFHSILRYDGRPFYVEDLLGFIKNGKLSPQYKLI